MLTNHDMDSATPFACLLVGQPTLRHTIKLGVLAALEQRITVRYKMKGMTPDETASYIRHHLEEAGRTADLFTDDAVAQIHHRPRQAPHRQQHRPAALIATAVAGKNLVDQQPPEPPSPRSPTHNRHLAHHHRHHADQAPQPTRLRGFQIPATSATTAPPSSASSVTRNTLFRLGSSRIRWWPRHCQPDRDSNPAHPREPGYGSPP